MLSLTRSLSFNDYLFFMQPVEERRVQWIADQLQSLDIGDTGDQPPKLKIGTPCLARFSVDKKLYRAKVEHADHSDPVCPTYQVSFIDFGNKEKVKATSVKQMDPGLSSVPAQAHIASLAYLKVICASLFFQLLSFILCYILALTMDPIHPSIFFLIKPVL